MMQSIRRTFIGWRKCIRFQKNNHRKNSNMRTDPSEHSDARIHHIEHSHSRTEQTEHSDLKIHYLENSDLSMHHTAH